MKQSDGFTPLLPTTILTGIPLAVIDARTHRLPDVYLIPTAVSVTTVLILATALTNSWERLATAALAAAIYGGLHFLMALTGWSGLGDAKLAATLGLVLGFAGWGALLVGVVGGALLAFPHALAKALSGKRKEDRSGVPFGPYMIAAAVLTVGTGLVIAG